MAKSARERIERAFHVSFMLPEQATKLLDEYREEILTEERADVASRIRAIKYPKDAGIHWHWFVFGVNRAADFLEGK